MLQNCPIVKAYLPALPSELRLLSVLFGECVSGGLCGAEPCSVKGAFFQQSGVIDSMVIVMALSWILGKSYRVKCPDGSSRSVYRSIDDAFPLSIQGWTGDLAAEARGMTGEAAKIKGAYATKVQGLLFGLDELTQTLVLNFRGIYMVYVSDPCGNSGFFQREVEKLVAEQQRLARLRIQVRTLLELAKAKPADTSAFLD